ncbi:MAG TPA: hypothetical protein ENH85_06725 [Candidatus Scalindua sp.]|nr:hypothetical protein [Candidatus Scalindua sp.]
MKSIDKLETIWKKYAGKAMDKYIIPDREYAMYWELTSKEAISQLISSHNKLIKIIDKLKEN